MVSHGLAQGGGGIGVRFSQGWIFSLEGAGAADQGIVSLHHADDAIEVGRARIRLKLGLQTHQLGRGRGVGGRKRLQRISVGGERLSEGARLGEEVLFAVAQFFSVEPETAGKNGEGKNNACDGQSQRTGGVLFPWSLDLLPLAGCEILRWGWHPEGGI